jgi:molybdopterin-containing oxidoreductase family iron-sulfur binding subunit
MGASLALGGFERLLESRRRRRMKKSFPTSSNPKRSFQAKPLYFATAMPLQGFGRGVLARVHMGRPTKFEGNPEHPASLGATDAFTKASVLGLYDPDRSHAINNAGRISTWNAFFAALNSNSRRKRLNRGAGLRILTETVTSPTFAQQIKNLLGQISPSKVASIPTSRRSDNARQGSRLAFADGGHRLSIRCRGSDRILSARISYFRRLASVRYAHDFARKRRVNGPGAK